MAHRKDCPPYSITGSPQTTKPSISQTSQDWRTLAVKRTSADCRERATSTLDCTPTAGGPCVGKCLAPLELDFLICKMELLMPRYQSCCQDRVKKTHTRCLMRTKSTAKPVPCPLIKLNCGLNKMTWQRLSVLAQKTSKRLQRVD